MVSEAEQQSKTESLMDKEKVDLDPQAEFEKGHPTFDEPMTTIRLGVGSHKVTHLGLRA